MPTGRGDFFLRWRPEGSRREPVRAEAGLTACSARSDPASVVQCAIQLLLSAMVVLLSAGRKKGATRSCTRSGGECCAHG